ncbi:hypothetical protein GALMADRAFT_443132 [Galerina marginata CBS 339.88]|uniref:Uncharacterized protein n=1 Tax=Galerina marginata (strain CBS 339.88) TaxID=685588 RepID=A0A067T2C7_GALM3|nr:hypothetical protein GALMADRAFT_443132 [Galerina marginata CBS 339.88]
MRKSRKTASIGVFRKASVFQLVFRCRFSSAVSFSASSFIPLDPDCLALLPLICKAADFHPSRTAERLRFPF